MSQVQSAEGEPHARRGAPPPDPRAGPSPIPVLDAPAQAPARDVVPRLVAEVFGGRAVGALSAVFKLASDFAPSGDQPRAIERLVSLIGERKPHSVLLGITGSGKTFTLANVIRQLDRPALVISPNKTLAAQLYSEFKSFFPDNAAEYFVSYYDYYQPEAYIPQSDTYIEKDALVNDEIDRMRHSTTTSLFERRDVVVVASVSCIYGIGEPDTYHGMHVALAEGQTMDRDALIRALVAIQYERNDYDFRRGTVRVRGDVVEIFPSAAEAAALRVEFWGDSVERLMALDPLKGTTTGVIEEARVYPASHYVTPAAQLERAIEGISDELRERLAFLRGRGRLLEAQRLEQRTI